MDTQRLMPNIEHRQLTNCLRISRERPVVQTSVKFKAASIPSSLFINLEIFFQRFFLHHQKFNFVKFYKELVTNKILTPCIILSNILSNICLTYTTLQQLEYCHPSFHCQSVHHLQWSMISVTLTLALYCMELKI
jgi:hypothetical protein